MAIVALIHPPTLKPSLWDPLRAALEEAGHEVVVPNYADQLSVAGSWWRRATLASVTAIEAAVGKGAASEGDRTGARDFVGVAEGADVLVAFSSAGLIAPLVCASRRPAHLVLIDAEVPAAEGSAPDESLAERAGEGVEPIELPEGFFEEEVGTTPEWEPAQVTYLHLSSPYAAHAASARTAGWAVVELDLPHLAVVSDITPIFGVIRTALSTT